MTDLNRDNRLVMLALFLWASGEGLFMYIQPLYVQQLGANPVQIGTVLSLAGLAMTVAFLPGGILSDRIPRKTILLSGWGVGILGVLTMASARDWRTFIPGIMLYSFSAFCVPAVSATVADSAGGVPLSRVLTLVYAGYSAGSVISPAVGGWLAQVTNMRTVYLVAAACYAVSMMVILMLKPRPVQTRAWQKPSVHAVRSNGLLALIMFALFLPLYIGIPLAPNFMRNAAGWPVNRIGLLGSLYALGLTVLSPALGRLSARHPTRGLLAGQALVWVSLGLLFVGAQGLPVIAFAAFFLRGGYGACRSLAGAQIAGHASAENRGAAFGLAETAVASAQMVAPYLAGWLYEILPAAPIFAGLALIPAGLVLTPMLGRQAQVVGRKSQPAIRNTRELAPDTGGGQKKRP